MKKAICILLCAIICVFPLCIGVFAEDTTSVSTSSQSVVYSPMFGQSSTGFYYKATGFSTGSYYYVSFKPEKVLINGVVVDVPLSTSFDTAVSEGVTYYRFTSDSVRSFYPSFNSSSTLAILNKSSFSTFFPLGSQLTTSSLSDISYTTGSNGYVDSGVTTVFSAITSALNFCLTNTYVLVFIGLALAVPVTIFGVKSIKSLIKGY